MKSLIIIFTCSTITWKVASVTSHLFSRSNFQIFWQKYFTGVPRNFVWGGPNRAACKFYELYIVPIHTYLFLILLSLQEAHTNVLQKFACQNVQYWSFYGTLKIAKIGSRMSFFLLIFQFPRFLKSQKNLKLQCWTFWHADLCNTFVCVDWSDRSIKNKYTWMETM